MKKNLLIFDIDGTLLYSNRIDSQCFAATYEKIYQRTFPTIDWTKFPHVTDDTIFKTAIQQHFARLPTREETEHFKNKFVDLLQAERQAHPYKFKAVPGAAVMINNLLKNANFVIGIGTGGWLKPARLKLQHIEIEPNSLLLGTADGKPTREDILNSVVNQAQKQFAISEVIYVGDAVWDVQTTRNLNIKFIGIRRKGDHHHLLNLGATQVLSNFLDYQKFLLAIKNAAPPKLLGTF